jgi:hypothetical protein
MHERPLEKVAFFMGRRMISGISDNSWGAKSFLINIRIKKPLGRLFVLLIYQYLQCFHVVELHLAGFQEGFQFHHRPGELRFQAGRMRA